MSMSANVRARTCSPYARRLSRADDDRRLSTSIFASVAGEGAAAARGEARRGESVVAVGEDTRGASARATLSASPRALATSSRSASAGVLESHSGFGFGFGFGFFGETASRAFPAELEPSAFRVSRADSGDFFAEALVAVRRSVPARLFCASEGSSAVRPCFVSIPSPSHETLLSDGSNGGGGGASSSLDSGRVHEVRPVADSCQYRRPVALHRAARHDCVFCDGVREDDSARTDET
jgi:hypothetical protein